MGFISAIKSRFGGISAASVVQSSKQATVCLPRSANAGTRPSPSGSTRRTPVMCKARRVSPMQASQPDEPQSRLAGLSEDILQASPLVVPEANLVQETIIGGIYDTLTASLDSDDEQLLDYSFTQQLRLAHKAEVFSVWPCAAMPAGQTNQVTARHNLPALITKARELQRLPELLAILHVLLRTLPPCSTTTSPHLLDTLDLLATCKRSTTTPDECKQRLDKILTPWVQPLQLIVSDRTFGKSTDQLSDNSLAAISSAMQPQTSSADVLHSSAVQPYTAEAENRNIAPQQAQQEPQVWLPSPEYMAVMGKDDLSPHAAEAYNLVANEPAAEVPLELQPSEQWLRHSQLLGKLGGGPHGKLAIKAYMAKHSTVFQGDFNKQMIERRRAQKQQALTLAEGTPSDDDSPSSGIHSTGTGADLRFAEDSSNESDDDSDGGCGDYCYL